MFRDFGGRRVFGGLIHTIKCFEDNSLVADKVSQPGAGGVLVVDGGGSRRCALLGDNLAGQAVEAGWSGILIYGCVRDVEILSTLDLGVKALASHPLRSTKRDVGEYDRVLEFAGTSFVPGHYLYADANGVIVSPVALVT